MNKQTMDGKYGYFKMVHGVTRRMIDQMPEDKLGFKPAPEVRSFSEIVVHMYAFLDSSMQIVKTGKFVDDVNPAISSKAELLKFVDSQFAKAMATLDTLTDAQYATNVDAWGTTFPAWQLPAFAYDEHWHHRGSLTVYLRLNGITPVMIYDYQ